MAITEQQQHVSGVLPPHILIVGGEPMLRRRIGQAFRLVGITYESALSARAAVERLNRTTYYGSAY
jgi:hypothetical protein